MKYHLYKFHILCNFCFFFLCKSSSKNASYIKTEQTSSYFDLIRLLIYPKPWAKVLKCRELSVTKMLCDRNEHMQQFTSNDFIKWRSSMQICTLFHVSGHVWHVALIWVWCNITPWSFPYTHTHTQTHRSNCFHSFIFNFSSWNAFKFGSKIEMNEFFFTSNIRTRSARVFLNVKSFISFLRKIAWNKLVLNFSSLLLYGFNASDSYG